MKKDNLQRRPDQQGVEKAFAGGGEPWNPQDYAGALPHAFDYKMKVREESVTRLRSMLAREVINPGTTHFTLRSVLDLCVPRKYSESQDKVGVFVQASCVITDGMPSPHSRWASQPRIEKVLTTIRERNQFHNEGPRNLCGDACLWGTVLSEDGFEGPLPGHIAHAIFNQPESFWRTYVHRFGSVQRSQS